MKRVPAGHSNRHCFRQQKIPVMKEFQVVGRKLPSDKDPQPKLFRMRLFADNEVIAKSRFW